MADDPSTSAPDVSRPAGSPGKAARPREIATEYCRAFFSGATTPSGGGIFGALAVTALLCSACLFTLTPRFLAGYGNGRILTGPTDTYAFLTSQVQQLHSNPPDAPTVLIIGASAIREGIFDEQSLAGLVKERTRTDVRIRILTADGLTTWEIAAALDLVSGGSLVAVVLEVSPQRFGRPIGELMKVVRNPRLAFDSETFAEELRLAGIAPQFSFGNYFLDHYRFFLARPQAIRNLFSPPVPSERHLTDQAVPLTESQWQDAINRFTRWQETYEANHERNVAVFRRMIQLLHARSSVPVALLEVPRNPRVDPIIFASPQAAAQYQGYRRDVEYLARDFSAPWWDLREEAQLRPEHFRDVVHMRGNEGRRQFTQAVAVRLADLLTQETKENPQ
jgi:hypothetical protein